MLFTGSIQDYVLLEKLNKLTVTKYTEMSDTAKTLITVMEELDKKCKDLYECMVIWNDSVKRLKERILGSWCIKGTNESLLIGSTGCFDGFDVGYH